jgi:hypothetical protein
VDVVQPTLFLADFLPQRENLRERARTNTLDNAELDQNTQVIVPIEQQNGDFFVFISPEAQLLQQAAEAQDESQRAFEEATNLNTQAAEPADEFVNVTTSIGRSQRFGGLTSSQAIAIYRLIDTFR